MAINGCCALWMENSMCFLCIVLQMSPELGVEGLPRAQPLGSAPPMDVVQQAWICAGRPWLGGTEQVLGWPDLRRQWHEASRAAGHRSSCDVVPVRSSGGSRGRGWLLLGQQSAPVGLHLLQPLHQVAIADLQLFGFIQRWTKLKEGRKQKKPCNCHRVIPFQRQSKLCRYQH